MKFRFTRVNINKGINDGPGAMTHQATFEPVTNNQPAAGMGMGGFAIPMTEAEAAQLTLGDSYTFALTRVEE